MLERFSQRPAKCGFIMTGKEKKTLDKVYDIPLLGLAAEYGGFIRWNSGKEWESRVAVNGIWKDTAKYIIESFVLKTTGSYLEDKEFSIVFQYKDCDYEYGVWQAKELVAKLDV